MTIDMHSDESCGEQSGGEDAGDRLVTSAPTKHEEDVQWEECTIPVDPMRADGVAVRRPQLSTRLDEAEDPILGLFLRFFPVDAYVAHLGEVERS